MKTNKKFPLLKCFTQEEIKRFHNGWITKSEIAKHVLQDISNNDDDDNLIVEKLVDHSLISSWHLARLG